MTFESIVDPRVNGAPHRPSTLAKPAGWDEEVAVLAELFNGRTGEVRSRSWLAGKRLVDIALGSLLAIAAVPIVVLLAIAVAIALREWPFFTHDRVGKDGELFRMIKIKTLPSNVPPYADKNDLDLYAIPALCRFLRATHIDELPQLLLVLRGKMSLVGPRPHWDEPIDPHFLDVRTSVRPGCTGLWQLGHHRHLNAVAEPSYDYFYVEHSSLTLDAWILWRTLLALPGLGKPRALTDVPRWARRDAWNDADALFEGVSAN